MAGPRRLAVKVALGLVLDSGRNDKLGDRPEGSAACPTPGIANINPKEDNIAATTDTARHLACR